MRFFRKSKSVEQINTELAKILEEVRQGKSTEEEAKKKALRSVIDIEASRVSNALRKNVVAYTPFIIFGIPVFWIAVWFVVPYDIAELLNFPFAIVLKVSASLQRSIEIVNDSTYVCTSTLPTILALLYISMFLCLVWVIIGWLVVHLGKTPDTLKDMAASHYLQSELWFSILLMTFHYQLRFLTCFTYDAIRPCWKG